MQTRRHRNLLSRVHPFLKMGFSFGLMGLSLFLRQVTAMMALVGGVLILMTQLKLRPMFLGYLLFTAAAFTGATIVLLGNISEAVFSTLRLLAILLPTPVLALTTPPAQLIRSLQTLRLPSFLTLTLMLIWRFFPLMQQELQRIWEANQLRGVDLRRRPRQWFSGLMVPLVFQMVVYADEVTIGLQTRGYSPAAPRSNSQPLRWRWVDTLFVGGAIAWLSLISYLEWG